MDQVSYGGPGAIEEFCEILRKSGRTRYIAEKLEKGNLIMYYVL